jgi:D-alanyl-D-alanine carboxypeptidase (penicillin-binding protein 5/6)
MKKQYYLLRFKKGLSMKKLMIVFMILSLILNDYMVFTSHASELEGCIIADSAVLIDKKTGRVLWGKNETEERPMASTTKIMTCIIALENANYDDVITVSHLASIAPEVKLFIHEDEQYYLGDLLYALMLESSNDVAIAIAEGVCGSVESFCELMTLKAKSIGALNTSYKTPNGLDADGHYTTAVDLALITRYALNNDEFNKIINTANYSFNEITTNRHFDVSNKNSFLTMYDGANGVKTGFTGLAGYCFVGSVKQDDMELISVVLACSWPPNKNYKWSDTTAIMDYGFENYQYGQALNKGDTVFKIKNIPYSIEDEFEGMIASDVEIIYREDEAIDVIYKLPSTIEAPIQKGDVVGEAIVYIDNIPYTSVDILSTVTVNKLDYTFCFKYVVDKFLTYIGG